MLIGLLDLFSTIILSRCNMVQITTHDNIYIVLTSNIKTKLLHIKLKNPYKGPPFLISLSPRSYSL